MMFWIINFNFGLNNRYFGLNALHKEKAQHNNFAVLVYFAKLIPSTYLPGALYNKNSCFRASFLAFS
ncbi:MAG: hypothetical protein K0S51_850 [Bacillales bacterium]|nr:hypothetical protein [Bacillales bacterium]